MMRHYTTTLIVLLLASGVFHIAAPKSTERWMTREGAVRVTGALLLLLAIPCLVWRGWYFWTLFAALCVSGIWRLVWPASSIKAQAAIYPRWVHGCLLIGGGLLLWAFAPA